MVIPAPGPIFFFLNARVPYYLRTLSILDIRVFVNSRALVLGSCFQWNFSALTIFSGALWRDRFVGYRDATIPSQRRYWWTLTRLQWHMPTGETGRITGLPRLTYFSEKIPSVESSLFLPAWKNAYALYLTFISLMLTSITYASESSAISLCKTSLFSPNNLFVPAGLRYPCTELAHSSSPSQ